MLQLSSRARAQILRQEAIQRQQKILDLFHAVQSLHVVSPLELRRSMVQEKKEYYFKLQKGSMQLKVDVLKLLRSLPLHLLACLISREPRPQQEGGWGEELTDTPLSHTCWQGHVSRGVCLLANLAQCCHMVGPLAEAMVADQDFRDEVIDLVNMVLLATAGPQAQQIIDAVKDDKRAQEAYDCSSMVGSCFSCVLYCVGRQGRTRRATINAVGNALLSHPAGNVFFCSSFDALRVLLLAVREALMQKNTSMDVYELAYPAGMALEFLTTLCAQEEVYARIMSCDPNGCAPLRLIKCGVNLHTGPLLPPPWIMADDGSLRCASSPLECTTATAKGALELLAARCCTLLSTLSDHGTLGYLDSIAGSACDDVTLQSQAVVTRVCKIFGGVLDRVPCTECPPAAGEAALAICILRLTELLADDSNFRTVVMTEVAEPVAKLVVQRAQEFNSRWCAGSDAVTFYESTTLDVISPSISATKAAKVFLDASKLMVAPHWATVSAMARSYALEQSVMLFKIMGNLHFFNSQVLPAHMKNVFAASLKRHIIQQPHNTDEMSPLSTALSNLESLCTFLRPLVSGQGAYAKIQHADEVLSLEEFDLVPHMIQELRK